MILIYPRLYSNEDCVDFCQNLLVVLTFLGYDYLYACLLFCCLSVDLLEINSFWAIQSNKMLFSLNRANNTFKFPYFPQ